MNKYFICILFSAVASSVSAQTFKETMIEFKKFEAKTRVGISYKNYIESLASVDYAVDAYNSEADDLNQKNKFEFKYALDKYRTAGNIWKIYINTKESDSYAESQSLIAPFCPNTRFILIKRFNNFDECLSEVWHDAANTLTTMKDIKKKGSK